MLHQKLCRRRDAWVGALSQWSCQSPVAHSCGLLNHLNSFHGGMFKLNAKFDADSLLYSVIWNAMATQYTCSLRSFYHPHWLVNWSCHCSCMHIPVQSPWLPGYIDVVKTVLVILTMGGVFLDRLFVHIKRWGTCSRFLVVASPAIVDITRMVCATSM